MGYQSAEAVDPDEDMSQVYVYENTLKALHLDSYPTTHPVVFEVYDPMKVLQMFDVITYKKGSCLVRMMARFIGDRAFQKGLQIYLKRHAYGNAASNDLWRALDEAIQADPQVQSRMQGHRIMDLMDNWIREPGYPVVQVKL